MSSRIVDLKELKDSRLLYEKDLPKFGYYIIIVVMIFLICITAWSIKTPKNYIVKGSGTVVSDNKNYIMSEYAGEITEIYIEEGTYVEEGEFLFSIKSTELNLQEQQIEDQLVILNEKQQLLERLEASIKDNTNYFSEDVFQETPYYNQFQAYKSKLEQGNLDPSQYTKYGYEESDIENEVVKNEAKMSEIYYSALQNTTEQITSMELEKEKLRVQQEAILDGKSEYRVMANASGIVHMLGGYKKGMVIQAGNELCSIANENDKYVIYSFVAAEDRPLLKIGDKVDIAISGLPENLYGTIHGKVQYIESDITTNEGDKKSYFKISVQPDIEYLVSKGGDSVNITNGMMVETRIIYDEVTYFRYMLEAVGMLTRG